MQAKVDRGGAPAPASAPLERVLRAVRRPAADAWRLLRYGRFERLHRATYGQMATFVYAALHESVRGLPDLDFVEV